MQSIDRRVRVLCWLTVALPSLPVSVTVAQSTIVRRVSTGDFGVEGNGPVAGRLDVDTVGRRVAYASLATNLVPNDTNGVRDIFLHDRWSKAVLRVSVDSAGNEVHGESLDPTLSDDGRVIAFQSFAPDLVAGDTNGYPDIFVRDLDAGTTERASVSSTLDEANAPSFLSHLSGNGRFVVFESFADNLVTGDSNGQQDVYFHDRTTGETLLVSRGLSGLAGNGFSFAPRVSRDGSFVSYSSWASDLVPGDRNGAADVFRWERSTGLTIRVSELGGVAADQESGVSDLSANGDMVAFETYATNLHPDDTDVRMDVVVKRISTGEIFLVTAGSTGQAAGGNTPTIDDQGFRVSFLSSSPEYWPFDDDQSADAFLRDLFTGATTLVSIALDGTSANAAVTAAAVSANGEAAAFVTKADDLVSNDQNGEADAFLRDRWLRLQVTVPILQEDVPFEILWFGGQPKGFTLVQVVAVNGKPYRATLYLGPNDSVGSGALVGTTPPGLSGLTLDLLQIGFCSDEVLRVSNVATMAFR